MCKSEQGGAGANDTSAAWLLKKRIGGSMAVNNEYGITEQQRLFADEYIKSGNATDAYEKNYKSKGNGARASASALLTNPNVKKYIQLMTKKVEKSTIADIEEIKEFWTKLFREGTHTVSVNGNKADLPVDVKDRLKASEFLAKTGGAFIERTESTTIDLTKSMTKEERQRRIDELLKR